VSGDWSGGGVGRGFLRLLRVWIETLRVCVGGWFGERGCACGDLLGAGVGRFGCGVASGSVCGGGRGVRDASGFCGGCVARMVPAAWCWWKECCRADALLFGWCVWTRVWRRVRWLWACGWSVPGEWSLLVILKAALAGDGVGGDGCDWRVGVGIGAGLEPAVSNVRRGLRVRCRGIASRGWWFWRLVARVHRGR